MHPKDFITNNWLFLVVCIPLLVYQANEYRKARHRLAWTEKKARRNFRIAQSLCEVCVALIGTSLLWGFSVGQIIPEEAWLSLGILPEHVPLLGIILLVLSVLNEGANLQLFFKQENRYQHSEDSSQRKGD